MFSDPLLDGFGFGRGIKSLARGDGGFSTSIRYAVFSPSMSLSTLMQPQRDRLLHFSLKHAVIIPANETEPMVAIAIQNEPENSELIRYALY